MPFITFLKKRDARTGNIIFQYLFCKVMSIKFGHTYIPIEEYRSSSADHLIDPIHIYDSNAREYYNCDPIHLEGRDIICDGYFQQSDFYVPMREELINQCLICPEYWVGFTGARECIKDFIMHPAPVNFGARDIVISLRLDDFIQLPRETSDILPPEFYIDQIDQWCEKYGRFQNLYIVMDKFKHDWERRYVEYFGKWNPILLQNSLIDDIACMRDAPHLIHSNSSLCWVSSFLCILKCKTRVIPNTHFYSGQCLEKIDETNDVLVNVVPLSHHAVYNINVHNYVRNHIHPIAYCVPDEYIVSDETALANKHMVIADLVPGQMETYRFGAEDEAEYVGMYRESRFGYTRKKGGWDCLRHYEIMANGCVPIFKDLGQCPAECLVSFPKELIMKANRELLPWKKEKSALYDETVKEMLKHVREHCSASATAEYFLSKLNRVARDPRKVLMIMGNCGINYSRETLWIGLQKWVTARGGVAVEYPAMDFMYKDYGGEKGKLYGNGFTYAGVLDRSGPKMSNEEIVEKTRSGYWDLVIYGKVGPDEGWEGSFPDMPLWSEVFKNYGTHQIVFLYGGDECIDMKTDNKYRRHILNHGQLARCFVRELVR